MTERKRTKAAIQVALGGAERQVIRRSLQDLLLVSTDQIGTIRLHRAVARIESACGLDLTNGDPRDRWTEWRKGALVDREVGDAVTLREVPCCECGGKRQVRHEDDPYYTVPHYSHPCLAYISDGPGYGYRCDLPDGHLGEHQCGVK